MEKKKEKIRVLLTEQCNANCPNCFNKNIRSGMHMELEAYRRLVDYLAKNGISFVKIMGGEPTVHPNFEEAIGISQEKFKGVLLFTNALNDKIRNIRVREYDAIIYNFLFIDRSFDIDKLLLQYPGERILEVQVSSGTDIDDLTSRLKHLFSVIPKDLVKISLTLDCTENIFARRDVLIEKWNRVVNFILKDLHKMYYFDHSIPWCFFENTNMKIRYEVRQCNIQCAGLITADLWLQHCNQYQSTGVNLKTKDGFIPYAELLDSLQKMNEEKIKFNEKKICFDCGNFLVNCNGGCFIHKDCISPCDIPLKIKTSDMER